jgi:hypothetical protein
MEGIKTSVLMVSLNGAISTKEKVPTFNMDLSLKQVDIAQSFTIRPVEKTRSYSRNHQWKIKFNNKIEWKS